MDPMSAPIADTSYTYACPNCGNEQVVSGIDARCDRCGQLMNVAGGDRQGIVGTPIPGQADPVQVPPPMVAGGIGGVNDGTQVTHHVSSTVPGKPMAPIAGDPAGGSTLEGQAMDTPIAGANAERGGSG